MSKYRPRHLFNRPRSSRANLPEPKKADEVATDAGSFNAFAEKIAFNFDISAFDCCSDDEDCGHCNNDEDCCDEYCECCDEDVW